LNKVDQKLGKDLNRHFAKNDKNGQEIHDTGFHITNHRKNANQNHEEIPLSAVRIAVTRNSGQPGTGGSRL
jgi:hypothetical protein